jgi:hypothetical protein
MIYAKPDLTNNLDDTVATVGLKLWIGLKRKDSQYATWLDGSTRSFLPVANPTLLTSSGSDCVAMELDTGKWINVDCTTKNSFLCERTDFYY